MAVKVTSPAAAAGTVLAFDYGSRRIGVAVGETSTGLAHPLATLANAGNEQRWQAVAALVQAWSPALLVVGLPLHADGTGHAMTTRARRFARQLESRFGLPVALCDERFTTRSATLALRGAGVRAARHKELRDQLAAQLILQAYLDQRGTA